MKGKHKYPSVYQTTVRWYCQSNVGRSVFSSGEFAEDELIFFQELKAQTFSRLWKNKHHFQEYFVLTGVFWQEYFPGKLFLSIEHTVTVILLFIAISDISQPALFSCCMLSNSISTDVIISDWTEFPWNICKMILNYYFLPLKNVSKSKVQTLQLSLYFGCLCCNSGVLYALYCPWLFVWGPVYKGAHLEKLHFWHNFTIRTDWKLETARMRKNCCNDVISREEHSDSLSNGQVCYPGKMSYFRSGHAGA